MILHTDNKPIGLLFSADNNVTYHIPKYQREYVWNKDHWENLFDDIDQSEGQHFLGSIICINTQRDSLSAAQMELVDGQQRMTTISLLFLAIIDRLHTLINDKNDYYVRKLIERVTIKEGLSLRLTPSTSNSNLDDYRYVFGEILNPINQFQKSNPTKYHGNRQIRRAFRYFQERLSAVDRNGQSQYDLEQTKLYLDKLTQATLVKIDVASHADAFTLFETLNNRGAPLSAIDIIKNKLLGHLERQEQKSDININFSRWNQITVNLGDDYTVQERFFRQVYNAFKNDNAISVDKTVKATRSNLIRTYETLIERNANKLFDDLERYSIIYSRNLRYTEFEENNDDIIVALRNLENVKGIDGYMLLLFVEAKFPISAVEKKLLIDFLCKYFIRRNVTEFPPTRDLTNSFMDMIKEINQLEHFDFQTVKSIIISRGKPESDEYFKEKLTGDMYNENVGATRYILAAIENSKSDTREKSRNYYERERYQSGTEKFKWTIEHILPQGENLPTEWIQMIGGGDKQKAREIQNQYAHTLGNLTLTGYNPQLSNSSFETKKELKSKDGKPIGFNNGLFLNSGLMEKRSWTKSDITDRTHHLADIALALFSLSS
jgi:uncharacterized protein with ParB-like and HNH nuclease domain